MQGNYPHHCIVAQAPVKFIPVYHQQLGQSQAKVKAVGLGSQIFPSSTRHRS